MAEKVLPVYLSLEEAAEVMSLSVKTIRRRIADGTISGRIAKDLFIAMAETGKDPAVLVEERGLKQVTDTGAIEAAIKAVIEANPGQVTAYKAKPTMLGWFVGQVMKASGGKANPAAVNEILKKKLGV